MDSIYHIDEVDAIEKPSLFVDALVNLIGKDASNPILDSIVEEKNSKLLLLLLPVQASSAAETITSKKVPHLVIVVV